MRALHHILTNGTELFALCCWWWCVRRRVGALRIVGIHLLLTNLVEVLALFPASLPFPVVTMYNTYLLLDLVLMSAMLVRFHPPLRRWALVANGSLMFLWVAETAWFGSGTWLNIMFLLTSALAICAMSSSALWHLAMEERGPINGSPLFWLLLGMILYFGGIAPVFSCFNYLAKQQHLMSDQLYWIVRALCALRYLTIAWACILWGRASHVLTMR